MLRVTCQVPQLSPLSLNPLLLQVVLVEEVLGCRWLGAEARFGTIVELQHAHLAVAQGSFCFNTFEVLLAQIGVVAHGMARVDAGRSCRA